MRLSRRCSAAAFLLLIPLAAPAFAAEPSPEPRRSAPAPLHTTTAPVPDQYIVTLSPDSVSAQVTQRVGVTPLFSYEKALRGFAARLDASQLATVRDLPEVQAVEQDAVVSVAPLPAGEPSPRVPASSWGLDRIDQPHLPLDNQFNVNSTGSGVTAFILDSGIDYRHSEFGGRAVPGFDAIRDGRNGQDCHGHGTHVAGTVGGANHGVARAATLVSVRVLDCQGRGSNAGVIAGLDWVARNARQPAILNASLGGPRSFAVNYAATALSDSGVLPVVAAGNDGADACGVSPASADRVVTVGATNMRDQETDFSNFGPCLWIYAPGAAIVSARLGGGSVALNGTSMASPHVAGVAVLFKGRHPSAAPGDIAGWLADQSVKGVLMVSEGSPNRLVQTGGL
ncbi:S8 family peptidase [Streptomyces ficellus]|uniref:S8 family peptidase n=1 Tax=Streptomyces ficellus TaxID=1977088 RepID=A0ABT7Z6Y3_9ACTN|nr:S8 family peptidase [Streptomyces ficellus]MDN3295208.1 S8 family peptidase [Streptomyces ficellus]